MLAPRYRIRTIMLVVLVAALALAVITPLWYRPRTADTVDPFDTLEMIGPGPSASNQKSLQLIGNRRDR